MRLELARYGDAEEISVQNTFKLDGDVCQSGNTSIALIPNWHKSVENLAKIGEAHIVSSALPCVFRKLFERRNGTFRLRKEQELHFQ
jgi:hypothetical protein